MGLLKFFSSRRNKSDFIDERIKYFYENPAFLVDIEFSNRTNTLKNIWVEPSGVSIELTNATEYKITTHDKFFRLEFDNSNQVVLYLQYSFGFKLYKRPANHEGVNNNDWVLESDSSNIN